MKFLRNLSLGKF